jgi:hypothetical protein
MNPRAQGGFRQVEVIAVIVVLVVVGVFAVPRRERTDTDARVAAVKNMGGQLKSAALMAHDVCQSQSCADGQTLVITGQRITFVNGYPNAATVGRLVKNAEGFTASGAGNRFTKSGARTADCWVRYNEAGISAGAVSPPTIWYQSGTITNQATEQSVNTALRTQC